MEEMRFAPRYTPLAWGIVAVCGLYFWCGPVLRPLVRPYAYSDFATFYDASRCFATHLDPYDSANLRAARDPSFQGWVGQYFYPPPFAAVAVRPLALLPFDVARRIWVLIEAAAYATALVLFARLVLPWPAPWPAATAAALGAVFAPLGLDLKLGSVTGILLLLLVLFERARARGQVRRAALALAAAVLLKLTPALLVVFLLARRERRLVGWTVALGALLVGVCLPFTGWRSYVAYTTEVVPRLATDSFAWFTNQSLDALFWRLFVPNSDTTPWFASVSLYRVLAGASSLGVLGALGWLATRPVRRPEQRWWDDSIVLVASLLLARVTWEYMVILALPCFLLWMRALASGEVGPRQAVLVALAYALCALPFPYTEAPLRAGPGLLLESPRTYGMILLFVASLWARRAKQSAVIPTPVPAVAPVAAIT